MQRIPFSEGWAVTREPGLPVPDDEDDDVFFEESPASPDPSPTATSVYEITASDVVSESSSIPTSGLPTPPPSAGPPVPIDVLIRAAAQRLQGAVPAAAAEAAPVADPVVAPDAAQGAAQDDAPDADHAAVATPPPTPLRRSAQLAERAHARACPRRGPQRVAKMSTGGVRKQ